MPRLPGLTRAFFLLLATAAAGVVGCTRYGKPTPVPPTIAPLTTLVVNPVSGSDTTGNGTSEKPYKTLTKALAVVKNSTTPGLTIQLAPGQYTTASGEVFPIVVPTGVTINGNGYGKGFAAGTFINGIGEDTALEKLAQLAAGSAFATIEVAAGVTSAALNNLYTGVSRFPETVPQTANYSTLDALGSFSVGHATFGAGTLFRTHPKSNGIVVPGGNITCIGCIVQGGDAALLSYTLPNSVSEPLIVLSGQPTQSIIGGKVGILTDGTANLTVSYETFQSTGYAFSDTFPPFVASSGSALLAAPDFGNGENASPGGNSFIGVKISGIDVTLPLEQVSALGDYWTPNQQGANVHGQYPKMHTFSAGAAGKNVTIASKASGSAVKVGPIPPPTAPPSSGPTTSPSTSPTTGST